MARRSAKEFLRGCIGIKPRFAKSPVGVLIVSGEVQVVLNQQRAGKSVISDTVAAHPGIHQRQRNAKQYQENEWRKLLRGCSGGICVVQTLHNQAAPMGEFSVEMKLPAVYPDRQPGFLQVFKV
jgi:hypothetical protein